MRICHIITAVVGLHLLGLGLHAAETPCPSQDDDQTDSSLTQFVERLVKQNVTVGIKEQRATTVRELPVSAGKISISIKRRPFSILSYYGVLETKDRGMIVLASDDIDGLGINVEAANVTKLVLELFIARMHSERSERLLNEP